MYKRQILNLTRPYEHYEVTKQALLHGKHVFSEKPLAVDMQEADELMELAAKKGLRMGGAPDTFMGAGIQTARKVIDSCLLYTSIPGVRTATSIRESSRTAWEGRRNSVRVTYAKEELS